MKFTFAILGFLALGASLSATNLGSGTVTVTGTEPLTSTQRVFRDGVASTWAAPKAFPGTISCNGTCYFRTLTLTPGTLGYVQVDITAADFALFEGAYLDSFSPADLANNYLGDPGSSGTASFQVFVPLGHKLVLVFDNVNGGTFGTVSYSADGYFDTALSDNNLLLASWWYWYVYSPGGQ